MEQNHTLQDGREIVLAPVTKKQQCRLDIYMMRIGEAEKAGDDEKAVRNTELMFDDAIKYIAPDLTQEERDNLDTNDRVILWNKAREQPDEKKSEPPGPL